MKYLMVLVFGTGFFVLAVMLLSFFLRFFLLTWVVRLVGDMVERLLRFAKDFTHMMIFIFGTAILGAFIITLGTQLVLTYAAGDEASDPTMPMLWGLLAFFVMVAVRALQWITRRNHRTTLGATVKMAGGESNASNAVSARRLSSGV